MGWQRKNWRREVNKERKKMKPVLTQEGQNRETPSQRKARKWRLSFNRKYGDLIMDIRRQHREPTT